MSRMFLKLACLIRKVSPLFDYKDGDFGGGLIFILENRLKNENFSRINIKLNSLDNLLANVDSVDFIKIDAEGSEVYIIRGMTGIIERSPHIQILMEFYPRFIEKHISLSNFFSELGLIGFKFNKVQQTDLIPLKAKDPLKLDNCYILLSKSQT